MNQKWQSIIPFHDDASIRFDEDDNKYNIVVVIFVRVRSRQVI